MSNRTILALSLILISTTGCERVKQLLPGAAASASASASGSAGPATAAAVSGTFEVVAATDAKTGKRSDIRALFQQLGGGAMLMSFDGPQLTVATWKSVAASRDKADDLGQVCRAKATITVDWSGLHFRSPAIGVSCEADSAHVVHQAARAADYKLLTSHANASASLTAGDHTVEILEKDAAGAKRVRITTVDGTLELERATPLEKLDIAKLEGR